MIIYTLYIIIYTLYLIIYIYIRYKYIYIYIYYIPLVRLVSGTAPSLPWSPWSLATAPHRGLQHGRFGRQRSAAVPGVALQLLLAGDEGGSSPQWLVVGVIGIGPKR